jgi:hypothetical protein
VFKSAIEKFIKARPREWLKFAAFRASNIEVNLGYLEYFVGATHREGWQQAGALMESKADLFSFALELQKRMEIRYHAPPLPVDLTVSNTTKTNLANQLVNNTSNNIITGNMNVPLPSWGAQMQRRNDIIADDE